AYVLCSYVLILSLVSLFYLFIADFFVLFFVYCSGYLRDLHSFPTRRSSDLPEGEAFSRFSEGPRRRLEFLDGCAFRNIRCLMRRSEEHTSELQSRENLVCRLLLEKKKKKKLKLIELL